ncbi:Mg-dependent DNase [Moorella thermoacetica Y72]|uniref:Mg-dependent DNase n=1 Tax=Moorella thermoacetica Y72 TaxID=1325331 RepID=A0A0S6U7Y8_NEOTH|nr:Mg-dependent DNase [Moorella thermoacetica Y72]
MPFLRQDTFGGGYPLLPLVQGDGLPDGPTQGFEQGFRQVVGVMAGQLPDVEGQPAVIHHGPQELLHQLRLQAANPARGEFQAPGQVGTAAEIQGYQHQGLVHGYQGTAVTANPLLIPQGLFYGLSEADAYILDGVVVIYLQIALGPDLQVQEAVAGHLGQEVIKEGDAAAPLPGTAPVQGNLQADVCFRGLALNQGLATHDGSFLP